MQKQLYRKHETHRHILKKFVLLATIFVGYFLFVSFYHGVADGFLITWITWSFFVLCTPVADGGFLIDFPLRFLVGVRMIFSEILVWGIALGLNVFTYIVQPEVYMKTSLLQLFKHILDQPIPYWSIIVLSALGTFLSVRFGDELWDVTRHTDCKLHKAHRVQWRLIAIGVVFVMIFIVYDFLLKNLGIVLPI